MDTYLYRTRAWSKRGEKVYGKMSGKKFKRTSVVAGKCGKKILAPMQYSGTMDGKFFEYWFESCLIEEVPTNGVIVMDNATFHRKKRLYGFVKKSV